MNLDVSASIVLYRNSEGMLAEAIESFLRTRLAIKLYLIDNSPTDSLKALCRDPRCVYIFNNRNVGFGTAHNIALRLALDSSKYHLILNPDVYFEPGVIEHLFNFMQAHPEVGQVTPKILYPSGELQYSGKLLPAPFDLVGRRLFRKFKAFRARNDRYELVHSGYNRIMNVPHHLGCFLFVRTSVLPQSGLFDERMFMYMEDTDFTRRIHQHYETLYYPEVQIYHHYGQQSQKKLRLLGYHLKSAFIYFNKWGWFFDRERRKMNMKAIQAYSKV